MNRRPHLTLVALIVAGLIGVGLLAVPGSPLEQTPTLGLDLQGGLEVTLQAVPPPEPASSQESDLDRSVGIMRDRVDRLGVAEPEIRKQGSDQIVIDLPGIKNPQQAIEILGKTAQLELFDLEANLVPPVDRRAGLRRSRGTRRLRAPRRPAGPRQAKHEDDLVPVRRQAEAARRAAHRREERLLRTDVVEQAGSRGTLPKGWKIFGVPPKTAVLTCGVGEDVCPGVDVRAADGELLLPDPLRPDQRRPGRESCRR